MILVVPGFCPAARFFVVSVQRVQIKYINNPLLLFIKNLIKSEKLKTANIVLKEIIKSIQQIRIQQTTNFNPMQLMVNMEICNFLTCVSFFRIDLSYL